jgi:hypothetical protein
MSNKMQQQQKQQKHFFTLSLENWVMTGPPPLSNLAQKSSTFSSAPKAAALSPAHFGQHNSKQSTFKRQQMTIQRQQMKPSKLNWKK